MLRPYLTATGKKNKGWAEGGSFQKCFSPRKQRLIFFVFFTARFTYLVEFNSEIKIIVFLHVPLPLTIMFVCRVVVPPNQTMDTGQSAQWSHSAVGLPYVHTHRPI